MARGFIIKRGNGYRVMVSYTDDYGKRVQVTGTASSSPKAEKLKTALLAEIDKGNYDVAQKYLANAFYIDENDFRYYYYQGLVNKNLGDYSQAEYNFKKCLKLNPKYTDAQKALDTIMNLEFNNPKQDSI